MDIEKRKEKLRLLLADVKTDAKHLMTNIDIAIEHLDDVKSEEDIKTFDDKYDIEKGLEYIRIF